jgi:putative endonuclease
MTYKQQLGRWGENYAEEFLEQQGISIIDRNVFTPFGEIDLIGKEKYDLIFFEVKTRTNQKFGNPEDSINPRKREHLIQSALHYIQNHPEEEANWRIDVIAIKRNRSGATPAEVEWFINAVQ